MLVENGTVAWRREEGLASVQDTLFLDLPAATPELEARFNAEKPTLKDRAYAEFLTIKVSFLHLFPPLYHFPPPTLPPSSSELGDAEFSVTVSGF